jgi:cytochrome c oxidase cbb3-type subunit 4
MDLVTFHSFWTVALLILFVGIVIWAYSSRRKRGFDEAARLPLEDDDEAAHSAGDKQHG